MDIRTDEHTHTHMDNVITVSPNRHSLRGIIFIYLDNMFVHVIAMFTLIGIYKNVFSVVAHI